MGECLTRYSSSKFSSKPAHCLTKSLSSSTTFHKSCPEKTLLTLPPVLLRASKSSSAIFFSIHRSLDIGLQRGTFNYFTIMPDSDNEGRMTKYDPWGNQISTSKSMPLQFAHKVEMRNCTQTFGFKGPDDSRHAARALDLVEKMMTRKVRPTEFELLRQPLLTSSIV